MTDDNVLTYLKIQESNTQKSFCYGFESFSNEGNVIPPYLFPPELKINSDAYIDFLRNFLNL